MDDKIKILVTGKVCKAYTDTETNKEILCIEIKPETADYIEDKIVSHGLTWSGDNMPIKQAEIDGKEVTFLKTASKYNVPVRGDDGDEISDIGVGSVVSIYAVIKEGRFGRKKYVSAYMTGVDISHFVAREEYNPFDDSEFEDISEAGEGTKETLESKETKDSGGHSGNGE